MLSPSSHPPHSTAGAAKNPVPHTDAAASGDLCCEGAVGGCGEGEAASGAEQDETGSSCPTPLSWRGVLKQFHADATPAIVQRDGYQLYCRSWGSGDPLYFLGGFSGTSELFALTASLLRDEFRCVLFDEFTAEPQPQLPPRQVSVSQAVDDLFAVADHFHDDVISLYGASLGGALGLAAMAARPDRVRRAALQGAFAHRRFSIAERTLMSVAQFFPARVRNVPLWASGHKQNHSLWFPPIDGSRWKFLVENCGDVPLRVIARRAALGQQIDIRAQLSEIRQPTFIIRTEGEGRIASTCQAELIERLPSVDDVWIDNTGQIPYLTHPHRLAKLLKPFVRGEPLPADEKVPATAVDIAASPFARSTETHDD